MPGAIKSLFLLGAAAAIAGLSNAQAAPLDPMAKVRALSDNVSDLTDGRLFISGYVNAHYMNHEGVARLVGKDLNRPLWQIREASMFFDATATDFLTVSGEVETSYDVSDRAASGRDDRLQGHLNYLYADISVNELFGLDAETFGSAGFRAGRILVPFLSYNENKPSFRQVLMSQPFTAWQLAPVNNVAIDFEHFGWSDFGVMINWERTVGSAGAVNLKLAVINGLESDGPGLDVNTVQIDQPGLMKPTVTSRDGLFDNRPHGWGFDGENSSVATVFKASYSLAALPADFGISWYRGKWDALGEHDLNMYGAHFNLNERSYALKAEYVRADVEETPGLLITPALGPAALNTTTGDYNMHAWYVEASGVAFRYGVNRQYLLRLVTRVDDVDTNDKVAFTPFDRFRVTSGLEWEFLPQIRARYEWQRSFLDDFNRAPAPYVAAGGEREIDMHMISLIAFF